jgi:superfamily II DNA or RNA helicase
MVLFLCYYKSIETKPMKLRPHQQQSVLDLQNNKVGIVTYPTGGGKTIVGIADTIREFEKSEPQTVCVVAPRIILACQLSSEYLEHIKNARVLHVHSGKVQHYHTTKVKNIQDWTNIHKTHHKLIFCTYQSLRRIQESNIHINTYIMDEAHNSVKRSFHEHVKTASERSDRCFFFTATPKTSAVLSKPGMNDVDVYGKIISNVSAPELVEGGYILKPRVVAKTLEASIDSVAERDRNHLLEILDEQQINKMLVAVKSTKAMMAVLSETDFQEEIKDRGYSLMHITSQYGAYIDGKPVNREKFFQTLNVWGKDDSKKFIVMNHSILGEGINVSCLDAVCFMRSMDVVSMLQNIGRTLRLHPDDIVGMQNGTVIPGNLSTYLKPEGLVICPVYDKNTDVASRNVQEIVDKVFEQGELAVSEIKK